MRTKLFVLLFVYAFTAAVAQNDLDALRYSQIGVGGTARFVSMGGAFGALGANTSCLSYNPAGIGIYRKGEINISPGLRFMSVNSDYNGSSTRMFTPNLIFSSGFGVAGSWQSPRNEDARHSLGMSLNQLQNFNTKTTVEGYAKGKSIMQDIIDNAGTNKISDLDPSYSGMAYSEFLLDTYNDGQYYGFIDPSKNMFQSKTIKTSGRMNELAIGYTYAYKDKIYFGGALGIPFISYNYSSLYTESDDKDSLRIYRDASNTIRDTYSYPVNYYVEDTVSNKLIGGFKSMDYEEIFKTSGSGYNLKLGIIYRVNDYLRIGANYQTPTVLNLTDAYSYSMTTNWDGGTSYTMGYPENGGVFKYTIITPMRFGGSIGFIYNKLFSIGLDYENVDYGQSIITSSQGNYFSGVNKVIRSKYSRASNLRVGGEVNVKPVVFRLGYAMYGSPFGETFAGQFVRTSYSGGVGFRSDNWTFDFGLVKQMYSEDYYMYNAKFSDKSTVSFSGTTFVATVGCKF
jgi:hypothetical protein